MAKEIHTQSKNGRAHGKVNCLLYTGLVLASLNLGLVNGTAKKASAATTAPDVATTSSSAANKSSTQTLRFSTSSSTSQTSQTSHTGTSSSSAEDTSDTSTSSSEATGTSTAENVATDTATSGSTATKAEDTSDGSSDTADVSSTDQTLNDEATQDISAVNADIEVSTDNAADTPQSADFYGSTDSLTPDNLGSDFVFKKVRNKASLSETVTADKTVTLRHAAAEGVFRTPFDDAEIMVAHVGNKVSEVDSDFHEDGGFSAEIGSNKILVTLGIGTKNQSFTLNSGRSKQVQLGESKYIFSNKNGVFEAIKIKKGQLDSFHLDKDGTYKFSKITYANAGVKFDFILFDAISEKKLSGNWTKAQLEKELRRTLASIGAYSTIGATLEARIDAYTFSKTNFGIQSTSYNRSSTDGDYGAADSHAVGKDTRVNKRTSTATAIASTSKNTLPLTNENSRSNRTSVLLGLAGLLGALVSFGKYFRRHEK